MKINLNAEEAVLLIGILSDPSSDICAYCPNYRLLDDCESDCLADKILKEIKNGRNSNH